MNATNGCDRRAAAIEKMPTAVLLVGGLGTRLRSVISAKPKALAPIGDSPFLKLLLLELRSQGIEKFVMCTGHFAEQIEEEFGDGSQLGIAIEYSRETQPLGTAGAIKLAEKHLENCSEFFVLNGDSFLELDFKAFVRLHRESGSIASVALRKVPNAARYGTVEVDKAGKVRSFREKLGIEEAGLINGGIYIFKQEVLGGLPEGTLSLEKDVLPRLIDRNVCGFQTSGLFIDIGTPEDYEKAQSLLKRNSDF
jgi:NDP-sugar pyrophosphorylase family protein